MFSKGIIFFTALQKKKKKKRASAQQHTHGPMVAREMRIARPLGQEGRDSW